MKKILILMLTFVFTMSCLVGCGNESSEDLNNEDVGVEEQDDQDVDDEDNKESDTAKVDFIPPATYSDTVVLSDMFGSSLQFEVEYNSTAFYPSNTQKTMVMFNLNAFPTYIEKEYANAGVELPKEYKAWQNESNTAVFVYCVGNNTARGIFDKNSELNTSSDYLSNFRSVNIAGMPAYAYDQYFANKLSSQYFIHEINGNCLVFGINAGNPSYGEDIANLFYESFKPL